MRNERVCNVRVYINPHERGPMIPLDTPQLPHTRICLGSVRSLRAQPAASIHEEPVASVAVCACCLRPVAPGRVRGIGQYIQPGKFVRRCVIITNRIMLPQPCHNASQPVTTMPLHTPHRIRATTYTGRNHCTSPASASGV